MVELHPLRPSHIRNVVSQDAFNTADLPSSLCWEQSTLEDQGYPMTECAESLGSVTHYRCLMLQDYLAPTRIGKEQTPKLKVWFLLNMYHFPTITSQNTLSRTIVSWRLSVFKHRITVNYPGQLMKAVWQSEYSLVLIYLEIEHHNATSFSVQYI